MILINLLINMVILINSQINKTIINSQINKIIIDINKCDLYILIHLFWYKYDLYSYQIY